MAANNEQGASGASHGRRYPTLVLRTMRGGLVDPADVPEDPEAEARYADIAARLRALLGCQEIRVGAGTDEAGNPRLIMWMPQSAARRLAALTEGDAAARLRAGDGDGARLSMQYARDLRDLMRLGRRASAPPPRERHN